MSGKLKTACGLGSVYTVVTGSCNEMGAETAVRVLLCPEITVFFFTQLHILRLLLQSKLLIFVNSVYLLFLA